MKYFKSLFYFYLSTILFIHLAFCSYAQNQTEIDSLLALLPKLSDSPDSTKAEVLLQLSNNYLYEDTINFIKYLEQAEVLANTKQLSNSQGRCKQLFAVYLHRVKGKNSTAITNYLASIKFYEKTDNYQEIARNYYDIASIYLIMGNYTTAMRYVLKILKKPTLSNNYKVRAKCHHLLGQVYYLQDDFKQAINYQIEGLEILRQNADENLKPMLLNSLAIFYLAEKQYAKAIKTNQEAIDIYTKRGDSLSMMYPIHNMGDVYLKMKDYKKALPYFDLSMRIQLASGSALDISVSYTVVALCYVGLGQADKAELNIKKGLVFAKNNEEFNAIANGYEVLSMIDSMRGNFPQAMMHYKKAISLRDSLNSKDRIEQMARMKTMYDGDKKDAENLALKTEQEQKQETIKLQYYVIFGAILSFVICVVFAITLYIANKKGKIANTLLQNQQKQIAQQNKQVQLSFEAISLQKNLLQNQHNEITDSIAYAQRIQQAVLPFADRFDATFGADNYFILYKPRNVVSGDFYWLYENDKVENQPVILIVADCTGHGVPGAFMSMIGIQLLQEIVIQQNIMLPDEILTKLKSEIIYVLKQQQSKTNDGMDAVAISIDKPNKKVLFAGAMNPLFYIQDAKLTEIKGDKISIGGMYSDEGKSYTSTTILCENTTTFYLISDGYRDQFGGKLNKKFTSKRMRNLLMENHLKPMEIQKNNLENALNEWIQTANETQTDDITVLGIKI